MSAPISWGERGHTKWDFVPILENKLADYIMPDVTWTGGITELKKDLGAVRGLFHPGVSARRCRSDQRRRRRAGDDDCAELHKLETSEWNLHKYDVLIDKPLDNSNGSLKLTKRPGLGVEMNSGTTWRQTRSSNSRQPTTRRPYRE